MNTEVTSIEDMDIEVMCPEEMNPRVKHVLAQEDYTLHIWFCNGEEGVLDMNPYLNKGIFQALKDKKMFNSVKPFIGTIQWDNLADLCPDTVYLDSVKLTKDKYRAFVPKRKKKINITMTEISTFYEITVSMLYGDCKEDKKPQIHAKYQDFEATFSIPDGELLTGNLPQLQMDMVQVWIDIRAEDLMANWKLAIRKENIFKLDPLR